MKMNKAVLMLIIFSLVLVLSGIEVIGAKNNFLIIKENPIKRFQGYVVQECSDSDGGLNYNVSGKVIYNPDSRKGNRMILYDQCVDANFLTEYYCRKDYEFIVLGVVKRYDCSKEGKSCKEGACAAVSNQTNQTNTTITNGQCATSLNGCVKGIFQDVADTNTTYLWTCLGINGGTTASCSLARPTNQTNQTNTTCTNDCSYVGQTTCSGDYFKSCGNYDADSCLEWNAGIYCTYGCVSGGCESAPNNRTNQTNQTKKLYNITIMYYEDEPNYVDFNVKGEQFRLNTGESRRLQGGEFFKLDGTRGVFGSHQHLMKGASFNMTNLSCIVHSGSEGYASPADGTNIDVYNATTLAADWDRTRAYFLMDGIGRKGMIPTHFNHLEINESWQPFYPSWETEIILKKVESSPDWNSKRIYFELWCKAK